MPITATLYIGVGDVTSITINGIHISAVIGGKPVDVRGTQVSGARELGDDWYDEDHAKFAAGINALRRMLVAKGGKPH